MNLLITSLVFIMTSTAHATQFDNLQHGAWSYRFFRGHQHSTNEINTDAYRSEAVVCGTNDSNHTWARVLASIGNIFLTPANAL